MKRFSIAVLTCLLAGSAGAAEWLPTGQTITPLAAPGSRFDPLALDLPKIGHAIAGQAVTTALTPDGRTLFVLTSGYNSWRDGDGKTIAEASSEHLFIYDVLATLPKFLQAVPVDNTFGGLAVADDKTLYVGGGADDTFVTFSQNSDRTWSMSGQPVKLGHTSGNAVVRNPKVLKPSTAGLALTRDGNTLVIANYQNDSITVVSLGANKNASELDLRPGKIDPKKAGVPGGEFPYWVAVKANRTAFVSSVRDREIVVVALGDKPKVTARIKVAGNPTRLLLNRAQTRLYVAEDNADRVDIFDTATNQRVGSVAVGAPDGYSTRGARLARNLPGASPNSLVLSPDETRLYVTDGGTNAVSVIALAGKPTLLGLIPTAWQPNAVSVSANGKTLYVANGKSPTSANPRNCMKTSAATPKCSKADQEGAANQYVFNLTTGGLQTIPVPDAITLKRLTAQVADNNGFRQSDTAQDRAVMSALRGKIKHVIYIVRENRTYDQILGDLPGADGDPSLVQFDASVTPNAHALASDFVALDSFFDSGEVSGDGWAWSTSARTTDAVEKQIPVNYADRGMTYDEEGSSRGVNVALPVAQRGEADPITVKDPDLLPGPANETAPDGPSGEFQQGYLWNAVQRAKLSLRNYGFFLDIVRYFKQVPAADRIPLVRDPAVKGVRVAYSASPDLASVTDIFFRGFDNSFPDYWRFQEWAREFDTYDKNGNLPQFETVRFMHDHTGDFSTAIDGVNTPETQIADNDYAVGLLIEKIAKSRYAKDTLVFVIEDDAQDGPDHVDAHRSVAFVAGPYVKQHAVVSERYTTVNMIRTIEEILGLSPLNIHDAHARPMSAVFDLKAATWSYTAQVPAMLRSTSLPLPPVQAGELIVKPAHDVAYWTQKMKGFDFTAEDRLDSAAYNQILWQGLKPNQPYPVARPGTNMRHVMTAQ
ncbi:MAG: beta-propeller fold lactonase family protein [Proteobacteria bacterium]|nr:beta-propeller fold lactonase family protein [Pseudomonadota bacterium]